MKIIIHIILLAIISVALIGNSQPAYAESSSNDFAEVDAYIAEAMHSLPIKGMALAIVRGDQTVYMQGYGIANNQGDPATPQTPWPMESVTKSFTALAVRQLASAGKINLSSPLQTYLPEFQLADQQAASAITIQELLDHTSGISKQEGEAPYFNSPKATFPEALGHLASIRPTYRPGDHFEYSNWNYALLAQVVSRVSGMTYTDYVQQNIFTPLGMSHSTFADFHSLPHAATGNMITYGFSVPYDDSYAPVMTGADNLTSTAEDMAHFLSLFLGKGQYHNAAVLPVSRAGFYGTMWEWHPGYPDTDASLGLSGGADSMSTSCVIFPGQGTAVVILLNTRLDILPGSISAYNLAMGIGNIINYHNYQAPNSQGFHKAWFIADVTLLLLISWVGCQVVRLKRWQERFNAGSKKFKMLAWLGIVLDLLVCLVIVIFPTLFNVDWKGFLFHLAQLAYPLLFVAIGLGMLGLIKVVRTRT